MDGLAPVVPLAPHGPGAVTVNVVGVATVAATVAGATTVTVAGAAAGAATVTVAGAVAGAATVVIATIIQAWTLVPSSRALPCSGRATAASCWF